MLRGEHADQEAERLANLTIGAAIEVHRAQALAYLAAMGLHLALLINFNVATLKQGIKRVVRDLNHHSPS